MRCDFMMVKLRSMVMGRDMLGGCLTAAHDKRIKYIVRRNNITHAELAKAAGTSRLRISSILNNNLHQVSTDLLIRILAALGYEVSISVTKAKAAA